MKNKSLWVVALTVPLAIVAVVWAFAGVFLFHPAPALEATVEYGKTANNIDCVTHENCLSANLGYRQGYPQQGYSLQGYRQNEAGFSPPFGYRHPQLNSTASSTGDYLAQVSKEGSFRWAMDRLPLDVYISDGRNVPGYQPHYRTMMMESFQEWADKSGGLMNWREVSSPRQADITVSWTANPTIRPGSVEAGQTKTLVSQNRFTGEGTIMTAEISILTELMGRGFSDDNMRKTCLHEVGHALGLQGHSDVPSDIMYPTVNEQQVAKLKQRDLNTLAKLYSEPAAVAETPRARFGRSMPMPAQDYATNGGAMYGNDERGFVATPDVPPWMNRSIGQAPPSDGGHYMRHMGRRAAFREMMRRQAEQNGWYN